MPLAESFPALTKTIDKDGTVSWYRFGKLHRDDGPAVERKNGDSVWYKNGKIHRDGKPAVENADGTEKWYCEGQLHRDGGPSITYSNGNKEWHQHGQLHREDGGPAIIHADGTAIWFQHGKRHREDGPAIEHPDGRGNEYWLEGERVTAAAVWMRMENAYKNGTERIISVSKPLHLSRRMLFSW